MVPSDGRRRGSSARSRGSSLLLHLNGNGWVGLCWSLQCAGLHLRSEGAAFLLQTPAFIRCCLLMLLC